MTAVGAGIGAVIAIAGGVFAARYGRRASVVLSAELLKVPQGYMIVARPCIKAVGVLRVRLDGSADQARVLVAEMRVDGTRDPYPVHITAREGFLMDAFVDGSEELTTTTLLPIPSPDPKAIGWTVWFHVSAPNRFLRPERRLVRPLRWVGRRKLVRKLVPNRWLRCAKGWLRPWNWVDQVFVPLPTPEA